MDDIESEKLKRDIGILQMELEETKQALRSEQFKREQAQIEKTDILKQIQSLNEELEKSESLLSQARAEKADLEQKARAKSFEDTLPKSESLSELHTLRLELDRLRGGILFLNHEYDDKQTAEILKVNSGTENPKQNSILNSEEVTQENTRAKEIEVNSSREIINRLRAELNFKNALVEELRGRIKEAQTEAAILSAQFVRLKKEKTFQSKTHDKDQRSRGIILMDGFHSKLREAYNICLALLSENASPELIKLEKSLNDCTTEFRDIKDSLFNE